MPDALAVPHAQLAVKAAQAVAKDAGSAPASPVVVLQRIRRWQEEGKVKADDLVAVSDMFDQVEDTGLPDDDIVVTELAPILQRRLQHEAIKAAMEDYAKRGDLSKVTELLAKASSVGKQDNNAGILLGGNSFADIEQLQFLDKLPTGIDEIDLALGGGIPRGTLSIALGASGEGKSIMLSQLAAYACMHSFHVAYATLELGPPFVLARLKSAITGVPIDAIMACSQTAKDKLDGITLGPLRVKEFSPLVTTVQHIKDWVEECERVASRKLDLLVVDYADKLTVMGRDADKMGAHQIGERVYEQLRLFAYDRQLWAWSASQSTRGATKENKGHKDVDDVADAIGKSRVVDLLITLNRRADGAEMLFYIAKNRFGKSRVPIGPLPTDFAAGLVSPMRMRPPNAEDGAKSLVIRSVEDKLSGDPF